MNRPEPIELENNLGPDAVTGEINRVPWMAYDVDEMDIYIAEKDKEIAELKKKLMPCLNGDCILTCEVVEKYGKENAELKQKLDEKDMEIESLKASHYAESVDAGAENWMLRRALWLTRANMARGLAEMCEHQFDCCGVSRSRFLVGYDKKSKPKRMTTTEWGELWRKIEQKCRTKAEEYK